MHANRLIILADALERFSERRKDATITTDAFDLKTWWGLQYEISMREDGTLILPEDFCGTSACACGLAATLPEFNKLGLTVGADVTTGDGITPTYTDPEFPDDHFYDFQAIRKFFGISMTEAHDLFLDGAYGTAARQDPQDPNSPVKPMAVAEQIREFVYRKDE